MSRNKRHRSPVISHAMKGINEELIKCRLNEPVVNYRNRRPLFPIAAYLTDRARRANRCKSKNLHVHYSFISILYLCPILYSNRGRESASVTKRRERKSELGGERRRSREKRSGKRGGKRKEINFAERLYVYIDAWKGNKNRCRARALLQVRAT